MITQKIKFTEKNEVKTETLDLKDFQQPNHWKMVFLILLICSSVLWIHAFFSVFYISSQSCFPCHKNSKMDKSGVTLCRQGNLEPWWLGCSSPQPPVASLLFSSIPIIALQFYSAQSWPFFPKYRLFSPIIVIFTSCNTLGIYMVLYNLQKALMFIHYHIKTSQRSTEVDRTDYLLHLTAQLSRFQGKCWSPSHRRYYVLK